ncbi:hypothetical protein PIROE2DRAFT_17423, partial [Piromyces sp. E2]
KVNKIKLVLPNKNENVIPKKPIDYPLLEPPNVSILNQVFVTSDIMSQSINKDSSIKDNNPTNKSCLMNKLNNHANNNEDSSVNDINTTNKLGSIKKLHQLNSTSRSNKNLTDSSNIKTNHLYDFSDLDEKEYEKENIDNVLYVVKKPNIGLISDNKLYHEIMNNEVNDTTQQLNNDNGKEEKKNKKTSLIMESVDATKNPHSEKENECDSEFFLIPYNSLKSTIKHCQVINKDVNKLTNRNYPKKAATLYKDYYRGGIPIKFISSSTPEYLNRNYNDNDNNNNKLKEVGKLKSSTKSHLNQLYYYNSVIDNYHKYNSDYNIKAISLGNLKFHTAFQKNALQNNSLMINGHAPKSRAKSTNEINSKNENQLTYEEKRLKPYHSYSSYSSILSSYPSYTYNVNYL